jgi:hypothetical protein
MRIPHPTLAGALLLFLSGGALAQGAMPPVLKAEPPYQVTATLDGEKEDDPRGISGIACLSSSTGPRRCLVVNDERRKAQFVTIENGRMTPGRDVTLIEKGPSNATVGQRPAATTCGKKEEFDDLDGEGVAYAAPYFYVVGSHGCSRNRGKFLLSSFILARIEVDAESRPVKAGDDAVETTWRLADALRLAPTVGRYFGRELDDNNGLNVEGIAVVGDRLFVGLRAPSIRGKAYLVAVKIDDLFAPGNAPLRAIPEEFPLALGRDVGIRDLAPLSENRLLILAGPAQEQAEVPYSLFMLDLNRGGLLKKIGDLDELPRDDGKGKPEAIVVLAPDRVLILFDSLPNGGPREYEVFLN